MKRGVGMMNKNRFLVNWVEEMSKLTKPDQVVWIDGSEEEKNYLTNLAVEKGELFELNQDKLPGCYYHRTAPTDVARVEHLTYICTSKKEDAGPTNHWMAPKDAYEKLGVLFDGCMQGRTMYVIPYIMGPVGSSFSKVGVEITDSLYVVLNMRIMARIGTSALEHLGDSEDFVKGLHSTGELDPKKCYICHFPEDDTIWSIGSGYGGNALLGKKCFALRIASHKGKKEGWMAEHMLVLGLEDPKGNISYVAGAFPSACGKTNLAMLVPPLSQAGYKVWTVGDDIAWMRIGEDGRLWAVNPETGFFGVAPGTSMKTNPNAMLTIQKDTIFTNVALTNDNTVWWEGMSESPKECTDWRGNPWTPGLHKKAAHPNSRFTAPANMCPSISKEWQNPEGVPISAIIFGGRRAKVSPLVYQSYDWEHGVFVGATMASETTAAANGDIGVVRRDPMAMLPFCGYNMADYFGHWLEMGAKIPKPPKIFHVNWFRTDEKGRFMWPGYGENIRVLQWILDRCNGDKDAISSPIGYIPHANDIDLEGLNIDKSILEALMYIDKESWLQELQLQQEFFKKFGNRLPKAIQEQHEALKMRIIAI